ncbi:MAG: SDR family oxidoreductase [Alphaproteobacteria bacterium]|nr:SDR family oxidoreductase [Alphaproteobacteria bacterium]MBU1516042.1 SDR family oxidoreductase [Alphaproteobacteria bacterium]MBU2092743.1 SDR family oxidoreductase [Alphaproteobacteria bacterium]MBU2153732.1 SDR family oxidoreductase [Alphaproteobacteria bacterium]MBU2308360.1 SDR family oxidoreductase [Alphaproteobacteria bacterium]
MDIKDKVVVVTGGAEGIGAGLAHAFAKAGAAVVVVADRNGDGAAAVAKAIGGEAVTLDVSDGAAVAAMVADIEARHGRIDLFCSNAGVGDGDPDKSDAASSPDAVWQRAWGVNVMAHVHAARAVTPGMAKRGEGYILNTVSAAGLLSQIGGAVYSTTKHAAIGFAESLAITHGDQGIKVSVLCPQGVDTAMLRAGGDNQPQNLDGVLTPDQVAQSVIEGLAAERFLILPHPEVLTYMQRKATDYDRWLGGMRRLRAKIMGG